MGMTAEISISLALQTVIQMLLLTGPMLIYCSRASPPSRLSNASIALLWLARRASRVERHCGAHMHDHHRGLHLQYPQLSIASRGKRSVREHC